MDKITANATKIMDDGASAAINHLHKAVEVIDKTFGSGYAKEHPDLIGDFTKTAAIDSGAPYIAKAIQEHALQLSDSGNQLLNVLKDIKSSIDDRTGTEVPQ